MIKTLFEIGGIIVTSVCAYFMMSVIVVSLGCGFIWLVSLL